MDTPFSPPSDPTVAQESLPKGSPPAISPPGRETGALERPKKEVTVQSTGSGGLDAIIDREASEGDNIRDTAQQGVILLGHASMLPCTCKIMLNRSLAISGEGYYPLSPCSLHTGRCILISAMDTLVVFFEVASFSLTLEKERLFYQHQKHTGLRLHVTMFSEKRSHRSISH